MPGKSERMRIEVKESSTAERRTVNVILTMPLSELQLTDLLRQRGVIGGLDAELKTAVKRATEGYMKSAETLISGLVSKANGSSHRNNNTNEKGQLDESISSM